MGATGGPTWIKLAVVMSHHMLPLGLKEILREITLPANHQEPGGSEHNMC